jgi:hypothetical protein
MSYEQMNTKKYILWRWTRAGIALLLMGMVGWKLMGTAGHIFFLIATPCVWAVSFYLLWSNSRKEQKEQKRKLVSESQPAKTNPLAKLPPLRK